MIWTSPSSTSRRWSAWRSASSPRSWGWASTSSRRATCSARSRSWLLLSPLALVLFAGCYGSTEPATNVGPEGATLNARGTANKGPAHSYFEYWVNGTSGRVRATDTRHWPSGASGPFSEKVAGLYASKAYLFRACGADDGSGSDVCAQTRQFTTGAAVQDSVVGDWGFSPHFNGAVNAHGAQGTLAARSGFDTFTGTVTCLIVSGNKASVGAVGHTVDSVDAKETAILGVVDGGPSGTDMVGISITKGSTTPPTCPAPTSGGQDIGSPGRFGNDLVVNDAP